MSDQTNKTSGFGIGEAGSVPASTPLDELEAVRLQPHQKQRMVKCDCGHTVPESWAMRANLGTSCPDCYDRLADNW